MSHNFFRFFVRNFRRFGALNAVNLCGLALGFTAFSLIVLYVTHELSYDDFHADSNRVYRMEGKTNTDLWFANLGTEHARELLSGAYPEVETLVKYSYRNRAFVINENERFAEDKVYQTTVGSDFFMVFDFDILEGNQAELLTQPYHAVITKSIAQKYFGEVSALGQIINYDSTLLTVSGVIKDLPTHTHFDFEMIYASPDISDEGHFHTHAYLLLAENADPSTLEAKILGMENVAYDEFHTLSEVRLMPIQRIHLSSDAAFGSGGSGDTMQIAMFIVLAVLILIIAGVNYINLTFALFLNKGKEVGIRKVLGESRGQIIGGMARQSVLTTLLTLPVIGVGLYFLLPVFGAFVEVDLMNLLQEKPWYPALTIGLLVGIGLLTVIYPSIALQRMDITKMIKSGMLITDSGEGIRYRNLLIFVQFIFLFTLGISAMFMYRQIQFLDEKDKGFNPERVIKIGNAFDIGGYDKYRILKSELLAYPQISGVAFGPMMGDGMAPLSYKPEGSEEIYENLLSYGVDIDYFDVMGIEIVEGEFKRILNTAEDGHIVSLVNQSFVERYGWSEDPIGKKIILRPGTENELHRQVSAVFKDFHFFSFKDKIAPQIISLRPNPQFVNTNILIKTSSNPKEAMEIIDTQWQKVQPEFPIVMSLMDEDVQKMYVKEKQTGIVGISLSLLAAILSVAGIVGFMFYILGLKSKEIAIRKVLGASVSQIMRLLNRQLFYTILIAGVIGSISSHLLVTRWLRDYAYTIDIGPTTFIAAILLVYSMVGIIVLFQTVKSTSMNPSVVLDSDH